MPADRRLLGAAVVLLSLVLGMVITVVTLLDNNGSHMTFSIPVQRRALHKHLKPTISSRVCKHLELLGGSASLPLIDVGNIEYYGEIEIGTPKRKFQVLYDTGSSDFWVPGIECSECNHKNMYDPAKSSTFEKDGRPFQIAYLKGMDTGYLAKDDVTWAGLRLNAVPFGVVTNGTEFGNTAFDGIVGMGLSKSTNGLPTLFSTAWKQGLLDENVFAFYLQSNPDLMTGELILGSTKSLHSIDGQIVYGDVYMPELGLWNVLSEKSGFEGTTSKYSRDFAVIDTGTSLIGLPAAYYSTLSSVFEILSSENEILTVRCSSKLPDFILTLTGKELHLKAEDYILDRQWDTCYLGFFSLPHDLPIWLIGDVWIRQFYTVYDVGNQRIGFAPNKSDSVKRTWSILTIALAVVLALAAVALCYFSVKTCYTCVCARSALQAQEGYQRIL